MPRLRRTSPDQPGWTRRRAGQGFVYLDQHGERLPEEDAQRVRDLVIPPAWRDVWVTPYPHGHLQAVGTDDAGRRQYLYHPQWRASGTPRSSTGCWSSAGRCRRRARSCSPTSAPRG